MPQKRQGCFIKLKNVASMIRDGGILLSWRFSDFRKSDNTYYVAFGHF